MAISVSLSSVDRAVPYIKEITGRDGTLRSSKPRDGNAAYVWRMVAFQISSNYRHHCMPVTADFGVTVPADFQIEMPAGLLETAVARTSGNPNDVKFVLEHAPTIEEYHRLNWTKYERRLHYIKTVLDPICDHITNAIPLEFHFGTRRWTKALGGF